MPSVMDAAINSADASNSFSPVTLLKRGLARIHISRGMLKIRISVMELGRFTLRGGAGVQMRRLSSTPRGNAMDGSAWLAERRTRSSARVGARFSTHALGALRPGRGRPGLHAISARAPLHPLWLDAR